MKQSTRKTGKFPGYILRHDPASIGLTLTPQGWAGIDDLIARSGLPLTREIIEHTVATCDKQRFSLNADKTMIRANQGHSFPVDPGLTAVRPPDMLFHGTGEKSLAAILEQGLTRQSRQHAHLSPDRDTARKVGMRHGRPAILAINAGAMHHDGHAFFRSENGVWLCGAVPPTYITPQETP
jgi:putative RNA 2'-phosphotransferase